LFLGLLSGYSQSGEIIVNHDKQIDKLLEFKKDIRTSAIYRIQIFDSSRPELAEKQKEEFEKKFSDWPIQIVFNTPNYKVWVGNFRDQLEADRALAEIKKDKDYMYAFIFEPKFDFKKEE
jgi:hypothetical protein